MTILSRDITSAAAPSRGRYATATERVPIEAYAVHFASPESTRADDDDLPVTFSGFDWRPSQSNRIGDLNVRLDHASLNLLLADQYIYFGLAFDGWVNAFAMSMATNTLLYPLVGLAIQPKNESSFDLDSIIEHISKLQPGWAGERSLAPSTQVLTDIRTALSCDLSTLRHPEIEIDDDGTVTLLWEGLGRSFGLTFYGNGKVVGTMSPFSSEYVPWSLDASDPNKIASRLRESELASLLS